MTSTLTPGFYMGTLLPADLSGFTGFLAAARAAHEIDPNVTDTVPVAYSLMY